MIKPQVTLGHGAVVASGAVVTKDVDPYTIVAGTPAKPLRSRQPREIADRLIALAWWDGRTTPFVRPWTTSARFRQRRSSKNTSDLPTCPAVTKLYCGRHSRVTPCCDVPRIEPPWRTLCFVISL
jgi:hypothetical protein